MRKLLATATAALALAFSPAANAKGVALEANGARAHSVWGGELGIGYNVTLAGFTLRPMAGAFIYKGDNDRYYEDDLSNGQTRCRDSSNGQFASDAKCDNTAVKGYAKIEATYTLPASIEFGGGARFSSDKVRPYGTLSFPVAPKVRVKANAGDKYYAIGLRADI
ncbi:hypothetical protein [Novosphingobium mathurense]|uniref:Outer membrane protein beta-barrel domain-containing protein n=1 Tax=Novosphingobium mathurense TaxID=428990 RepID=A0A1U6HJT8_9SPHN|nr:hypothetical protein [Novosphingobium mathurense]SLJ96076.1 hypothetical protein SAMN06295987_102601 [Novosphingobium mathurense]